MTLVKEWQGDFIQGTSGISMGVGPPQGPAETGFSS